MKKIVALLTVILSIGSIMAQEHGVSVRLSSFEPNETRFGGSYRYDYPSYFEYDSDNRIKMITSEEGSATIDYGEGQIVIDAGREAWTLTLENGRVIREELVENGWLCEVYLYTYDSEDQLVHIERQVPEEPGRAMTFDIEWTNGQPTQCRQNWSSGKSSTHTYTYTDKQDMTLANYFVTPFAYIDNFKATFMPLFYCQNLYGKRHVYLPEGHYNSDGWSHTFSYEVDSRGMVVSIDDGTGKVISLSWDEETTVVNTVKHKVSQPTKTYSIDGRPYAGNSKGIIIVSREDGTTQKIIK